MDQVDRWRLAHEARAAFAASARSQGLAFEDAEDVASEVVIRAASFAELDPERVVPWGCVVARHLAIDALRKHPKASLLIRLWHSHSAPIGADDELLDRAEANWVAQQLPTLPPRQRDVLMARAAGHTPEAIAQTLNCTYKTVESLTSRGRAHMRELLAATLTGLGVILSAGKRALTPAPAAITLTALAFVCLLHVEAEEPTPGMVTLTEPNARVASPDASAQRLPSASRRSAAPKALLTTAPAPRPTEPGPPVTVYVGPAFVQPPKLEKTRDDEGLVQSTVACLKHGLDLNPTHVGCR